MLKHTSRLRIAPKSGLGHMYRLSTRPNSGHDISKLSHLPLNRSLIPFPSGSVRLYDRKYSSEFRQMYSQLNKYIDKFLHRNDNVESEDASTHKWGKSIIINNAASETEAEPMRNDELSKDVGKTSEEVISESSDQHLKSVEHSGETAKKSGLNLTAEENTDEEVIMFASSKDDEPPKGKKATSESKPSPNSQQMEILMPEETAKKSGLNLTVEENTDAEVIMFTSSKDDEPAKGKKAPSESKPSPISQQMEILMPEEAGKIPMAKKPQDVNNQPSPISQQMEVQVKPNPEDVGKGPQITSLVQSPQELVTHGTAPQTQEAGKGPQTTSSVQSPQKLVTQVTALHTPEAGKGPQTTSSVPSPQKLITQGAAHHTQDAGKGPEIPPVTKNLQEPVSQAAAQHLVSASPAGQPSSPIQDQAKPNMPEAPATRKLLEDPAISVLATETSLNVSPLPSTNPEGEPKPSGIESEMKSGPPAPGPEQKGTEEEPPVFFKTKEELVQILEEINDRINEYEMRLEHLNEQPLVEEISMEEYCDIARHPLRTDEGKESFWPHTEEEQRIGAFGIKPADEQAIEAKPLLTEEELQQHEEAITKKMQDGDGMPTEAPAREEKKDTATAAKQEVPLQTKPEISPDSPKPQGPSDEEATKK